MRSKTSRARPGLARALRHVSFGVLAAACGLSLFVTDVTHRTTIASAAPRGALRTPQSFASITDKSARSRALFAEAGKVIMSPRCVNCHPSGEQPTQREGEPHLPAVVRGDDGLGAVGQRCPTCHQAENYEASGVPGHPRWHTAPLSMAWQGKTLGEICAQLKDPGRNGNLDLAKLREHMASDSLVGWAWNPGAEREPAPGTQAAFGELIGAWIATGAECPLR